MFSILERWIFASVSHKNHIYKWFLYMGLGTEMLHYSTHSCLLIKNFSLLLRNEIIFFLWFSFACFFFAQIATSSLNSPRSKINKHFCNLTSRPILVLFSTIQPSPLMMNENEFIRIIIYSMNLEIDGFKVF